MIELRCSPSARLGIRQQYPHHPPHLLALARFNFAGFKHLGAWVHRFEQAVCPKDRKTAGYVLHSCDFGLSGYSG